MKTPSAGDTDILGERPASSRKGAPGGGIIPAVVAGLTIIDLDKHRTFLTRNPKNIQWIRR
jgi:hypothetical protein